MCDTWNAFGGFLGGRCYWPPLRQIKRQTVQKAVLEAFVALSLGANIIQFVEFSGKLFTKARQAHRSEDGATQEYTDLESTLERLKVLKDDLISSASTVSRSHGIRLLPSTLEEYFLHILSTTDETYSERAAETFEIALKAIEPLSLFTYSYIDEEDPQYGINAEIKELWRHEIIHRLQTMKRRLNARCNGLLEMTIDRRDGDERERLRKIIDDPEDASVVIDIIDKTIIFDSFKVDFLHRTVRDFLNTEDIRRTIRQNIKTDFQPTSAICRAFLAQIKALPPSFPARLQGYCSLVGQMVHGILSHARVSDEESQTPGNTDAG
ncbi:hypothetical protein COCC4DRAFT_56616 [Bipolaris maydis ATCC 48331]|uniref:DUF7791 domain-containing protein n=2 Tax=Cochliobolus heterostrophus TaxID=5016 RepID=M2US16_COCH5|nr:uncharacterized protein COCC4DRAFT_56616 [Bipolaris maydis ATCC 48331]EMD90692.1 hypothetical protein COCHEDRAFT_1215647 [Bipolaris maydis C5]ENI09096.1 hypothetical protein COCC4DRAFT_56616 [Bipolaris maydis ATCC 48331]